MITNTWKTVLTDDSQFAVARQDNPGRQQAQSTVRQDMPREAHTGRVMYAQRRPEPAPRQVPDRSETMRYLDRYVLMAGHFGQLDVSLMETGMTALFQSPGDEAKISLESVKFAMHYLPVFFGALVLDIQNIRKLCLDCIELEQKLDTLDSDMRAATRGKFRPSVFANTGTGIYAGTTCFNKPAMDSFVKTVLHNFEVFVDSPFSHAIDATVDACSGQARVDIGRVLSGFPYLMRALNQNGSFYSSLLRALNAAGEEYGFRAT